MPETMQNDTQIKIIRSVFSRMCCAVASPRFTAIIRRNMANSTAVPQHTRKRPEYTPFYCFSPFSLSLLLLSISYARTIFITRGWRTTSLSVRRHMAMPSISLRTCTACTRPLFLPSGRVNLRDVARYYHLAAVAHSREEHLHLFARGILSFVQNDEGI